MSYYPYTYTNIAAQRLTEIIEWLMIMLLVFTPLAFGAVEAWSQLVVLLLVAAMSLCFLTKLILQPDQPFIWSWSYVFVVGFLAIAAVQLIALPAHLAIMISPATVKIKTELLSILPDSAEHIKNISISFYPYATKSALILAAMVATVFVITLNIYRTPQQIERLLTAIVCIGIVVVLVNIAQIFFGNGKVFWVIPTPRHTTDAGPFINHSNYGQYVNMCIGAALALMMVRIHKRFAGKKPAPAQVFAFISSPSARTLLVLAGFIVIAAASVFLSLTRGGAVSMLIAAAITIMVLSRRGAMLAKMNWIMVLIALVAFLFVLYTGFDAIYERLATLQEQNRYLDRIGIVKDIIHNWGQFPLLGTGFGTHAYVYPMFNTSTMAELAGHAENEYFQTLEETGSLGVLTLVCFGIYITRYYIRNIRNYPVYIISATYGLGFGLIAILVHSFSDYGQHIPANCILTVIFCALLIRFGQPEQQVASSSQSMLRRRCSIGAAAIVLVFVAAGSVWATIVTNNARLAENQWHNAKVCDKALAAQYWQASDQEFIELLTYASAAARYQPDNIEYQHWLNVYRLYSISRYDPNNGTILEDERTMNFAARIADALCIGIYACPTYGPSYCVAGQIQYFMLNNPQGARLIEAGYRLAPADAVVCYVAGMLDAQNNKFDAAIEKFKRAIKLDGNGNLFKEIAEYCVADMNQPDLAVQLAQEDVGQLSFVATILASNPDTNEITKQALATIESMLVQKCTSPDAPASAFAALATISEKEANIPAAIEYYKRALTAEYGNVEWRFALARLLAKQGQNEDAIHQAKICLRLHHAFWPAKELIANLSVQ